MEPYRVILDISPDIAKYFKRKPISKTQRVEELREDGSMRVSIEITDDMEIIPLVKYWIPYIQVVKPTDIREHIEKELDTYIKHSRQLSSQGD